MRGPTAAEVILFARVLCTFPRGERLVLARAILAEADLAERHLLATGQAHPQFGDGSLMARSLRALPVSEPMADRDFLRALAVACIALLGHSRP